MPKSFSFRKISNFNWPGLGPAEPSHPPSCPGPSPGQLKFEIFTETFFNRNENERKELNAGLEGFVLFPPLAYCIWQLAILSQSPCAPPIHTSMWSVQKCITEKYLDSLEKDIERFLVAVLMSSG